MWTQSPWVYPKHNCRFSWCFEPPKMSEKEIHKGVLWGFCTKSFALFSFLLLRRIYNALFGINMSRSVRGITSIFKFMKYLTVRIHMWERLSYTDSLPSFPASRCSNYSFYRCLDQTHGVWSESTMKRYESVDLIRLHGLVRSLNTLHHCIIDLYLSLLLFMV